MISNIERNLSYDAIHIWSYELHLFQKVLQWNIKYQPRTEDVAFLVAASYLQKLQKTTTTDHTYHGSHGSPGVPCLHNIVCDPFRLHNIYSSVFHALPRPQLLGGLLHGLYELDNNWVRGLHPQLLHRRSSFLLVLVRLLNSIFYFPCASWWI